MSSSRTRSGQPAHTYQLSGLVIESDHELATLAPAGADSAAVGERIRVALNERGGARRAPDGPPLYVLPQDEDDQRPFLTVWRDARGALLRVHGQADFRVSPAGERVMCMPENGCPLSVVEQLLVDRILPRVMHLMGIPCLHAAAVRLPGAGVVALAGPALSGKSSTCAALCQRGCELVCDDRLRVAPCAQGVRAYPGYSSLRLWPVSARALLGAAHCLPPASPHTTKRRLRQRLSSGPLLLARVLVMAPSEGPARLEPIGSDQVLETLAAGVLRLDPADPRALRAEFEALTSIAAQVPTARLRFEHDWSRLGELVDVIGRACAGP